MDTGDRSDESLEAQAGRLLQQRGLRLAVAESCTGGLIADRLTNVPGSSAYFVGGVVAYAYEAKTGMLGVSQATLEAHGAVSRETVLEMATGVRALLAVDISLSISGIAGPSGGIPGKPVGTVWIGLAAPDLLEARNYRFEGDRLENKAAFADQALHLLLGYLQEHP